MVDIIKRYVERWRRFYDSPNDKKYGGLLKDERIKNALDNAKDFEEFIDMVGK